MTRTPSPRRTLEALERDASSCAEAQRELRAGLKPGSILLNAYYLQESAALDLRAGKSRSAVVDEVFAKAAAMGAVGVRTNAFNDDARRVGTSALQVAPLTYDETAFRGLDLVLAGAHAAGLRLVLPLGNTWDAYGGARRYVEWAGLPRPREADARFFTDPRVVDHYRQHVVAVLSRVNTLDGLRYGAHPAVLAWELVNEPRGKGLDARGHQLREWVDAVGATVREHAPGHFISTGEEGFEGREGIRYSLNLASPFIDLASFHCYPEAWGVAPEEVAAAGARWISEHAAAALAAGKPALLGEFGLRSDGPFTLPERRALYRGWLRCARRAGVAASAPWLFAPDSRPERWDPHTFHFRDGTAPEDPCNQYVDLLRESAAPPAAH